MFLINTSTNSEIKALKQISVKGDINQDLANLVFHLNYDTNTTGSDIKTIFKMPKQFEEDENYTL